MAPKLAMEIFAYDIFQTAFLSHGLIREKSNMSEIYGDEYGEDLMFPEACDDLFHKAIFCQRVLFKVICYNELKCEKIKGCKSPSDLFDHLINRIEKIDFFHSLNVFERMFATCAFVVSICVNIYWYNVVDVITYGHLFWALYFNLYCEEFYEEGGWKELKRVAKTYELLCDFLVLFPENIDCYVSTIEQATINYRHFREITLLKDSKHISKMWVKFCAENVRNYIKCSGIYEKFLKPEKIHFLLHELQEFCDPRSKEVLKYTEKCIGSNVEYFNTLFWTDGDSCDAENDSDSGIITERSSVLSFNEFASDIDDSCSSRNDSSSDAYSRIVDTFSDNSSNNSIECNKQLQKRPIFLQSEANAFDLLCKKANYEYEGKTNNERVLSTNTSELYPNAYSTNQKSLNTKCRNSIHSNANTNNENKMGSTNNLPSRIARIESKFLKKVEDDCIFQKPLVEFRQKSKFSQNNLRVQKELYLVNKQTIIDSEMNNAHKNVTAYFGLRKINETAQPMDVLSLSNSKTTSDWNVETSPDLAHNSEDFIDVTIIVNRGNDRRIIHRKLDALRKEPDVLVSTQLLRMFLRLQDVEASEHVPAVVASNKQIPEYSSSQNLKNPKKRSKNEREKISRKKYV